MNPRKKTITIGNRVLNAILDGHDSIADIAHETGFQRKSISHAIKSLKRKNLIKRFPDLQDMRRRRYKPVLEELKRRGLVK